MMLVLLSLLSASTTAGPDQSKLLDPAALSAELQQIVANHPQSCALETIGISRNGHPLEALAIGRGGDRDDRPALAIVAGIDGEHPVSSTVALRIAAVLLGIAPDEPGWEALWRSTVYVIPCVNPDALSAYFATPVREQRHALRPWDDDRDGLVDEDGPDDLNGDGVITMMRLPVAACRKADLEPTHVADPKAERLMKKAERNKGETPTHALVIEGLDDDDDGLFNEDPVGGVDLNSNFPHKYAEHTSTSGPHQISEPESHALIEFFLQHPRIATAIFYGRHDNIAAPPTGGGAEGRGAGPGAGGGPRGALRGQSGRGAPTERGRRGGGGRFGRRRREAPQGLHEDDVALYAFISEKYSELTGIKKMPAAPSDGAAYAWSYYEYGIPTLAVRLWNRPEPEPKPDEEGKKGDAEGAEGEETKSDEVPPETAEVPPEGERRGRRGGRGGRRGGRPGMDGPGGAEKKNAPADADAAAWLKYSDEEREGQGFLDWAAYTHPQLGEIEIGGFRPYFRTTPAVDDLNEIVEQQGQVALDILERLPRVSIDDPQVKRLGTAVFEIKTALVNEGYFPTGLGIAQLNRTVGPLVVRLDVPLERIVGGQRMQQVWSIPGSGGRQELRWLITGTAGATVTLEVTSKKYGAWSFEITLPAGSEDHS